MKSKIKITISVRPGIGGEIIPLIASKSKGKGKKKDATVGKEVIKETRTILRNLGIAGERSHRRNA